MDIAGSLEDQASRSCAVAALEEWRRGLMSPNSTTRFSLACLSCGVFLEVTLHRLLTLPDAAKGFVCSTVNRICLEDNIDLPPHSSPSLPPLNSFATGLRARSPETERRPSLQQPTILPPDNAHHGFETHDQRSLPDLQWPSSLERFPPRNARKRSPPRPVPAFVPFNGTLHSLARDSVIPVGLRPDGLRDSAIRGTADPAMYVWRVLATQLMSDPLTLEEVEEFQ